MRGTPCDVPDPRKTKQNDMAAIYSQHGGWPAESNLELSLPWELPFATLGRKVRAWLGRSTAGLSVDFEPVTT
jgi:hypothetical protein